MSPRKPNREPEPPEPVLPRLLVLEIGAKPDRRRATGVSLLAVALVLGLVGGIGALGAGASWLALRPATEVEEAEARSSRMAPGTPGDPPPPEPTAPPVPESAAAPRPRPRAPGLPAPGTPGRLVVEGDAVVELQGEFGGFRAGTPLPPGTYAVWADFGQGLVDTGTKAVVTAGHTVTVICLPEHGTCALVP